MYLKEKKVQLYSTSFNVSGTPASDIDYPQTLTPANAYVNVKILTVLFFALTALAHVAYATDLFGTGTYTRAVEGFGWNPYRWFEYSVTASIMIYIISAVAGNKDIVTALTAAFITPGLMLQGFTTEREIHQNALAAWGKGGELPDVDVPILLGNFLPSWLFFFIKWFLIFNGFWALQNNLRNANKPIDPNVTRMVYIQFFGFAAFGIFQTKQVYDWWRALHSAARFSIPSYAFYEKGYILLSLVVKVLLGLSVAAILN